MKDCDAPVDTDTECPSCKSHHHDDDEVEQPPTPANAVSPEQIGSVKALGEPSTELPGLDHDADIKLRGVIPSVGQTVRSYPQSAQTL